MVSTENAQLTPCSSGLYIRIPFMKLFTYCLNPLVFSIQSDADTPEEALSRELGLNTPQQIFLLDYLHRNIDDYPTLNGSVQCIEIDEDY